MIKKSLLAAVIMTALASGSVFGQAFSKIAPADLGVTSADGRIDQIFNIGGFVGQAPESVTMAISNGRVSADDASWTVGEGNTTTFIFGGSIGVEAFVNHGANLGSEAFQNGSLARDGITSAGGETWTLVSSLDSDYTAGLSGNDYFIDYTGLETNQLESNSVGFRWNSDQVVSSFSVFSSNTVDLNNNYTLGFRTVPAVPEPAVGTFMLFACVLVGRRKRC